MPARSTLWQGGLALLVIAAIVLAGGWLPLGESCEHLADSAGRGAGVRCETAALLPPMVASVAAAALVLVGAAMLVVAHRHA